MKRLRTVLDWLLIAPALLPLFFIDGFIYPYLAPKVLIFRALGLVVISLFVYLALSGEPFYWQRLKNKFAWLPFALLGVAYLTSLLGLDFYRSFWSTFSRGDGLLTLTVISAFFYIALLSADERFVSRFLKVVAWVASLVALQALFEWSSQISGTVIMFVPVVSDRIGGTLGNPAFLACYLGLTFFITLSVARTYTGAWRNVLYASAVLQIFAILLTATRGTILALGAALLVFLIYRALWGEGSQQKYARGLLVGLAIVTVLFIMLRGPLSQSSIAPIARIASISLSDATVSSRFFLWQHLSVVGFERPLTGVGAEHIDTLFDKVYDPTAIEEEWFDRSHNSYLDYFLQYGIFGFLLYAALVVSAAYASWSRWKEGSERGVYIFFAVLVYALQNFFVFDTGLILWTLYLLFAVSLVPLEQKGAPKESQEPLLDHVGWRSLGAVVAVALLYFIWPVTIEPWRANLALTEGYVEQISNVTNSTAALKRGSAFGTYADLDYGYQVYQMYTGGQLTRLKGEELEESYTEARLILEKNFTRYPYDARTATYFAHVLNSAPAGVTVDREKLLSVLAAASALSPKREQPWYIKANIYIKEGDTATPGAAKTAAYGQAIGILKEYADLVPMLAEPYYVIASLYLVLKDTDSAKEWADEGLLHYKKGDTKSANRAAKYYIDTEDWVHAVAFLGDLVDADPQDFDSAYDLAKASFLAGDKERALEIVAQLRKDKPGFVEGDPAFLQALGQ